MKNLLLTTARKYIKAGLSVIVTDSNKRSLFAWKKYQDSIISDADLQSQLDHKKAEGLAIICGAVSGNLEVIDVDCKYALEADFFTQLAYRIKEQDEALYNSLLIIRTRSGGYHMYYKCEVIEGNQKLALRLATSKELKDNPQLKQIVLIETRGEAGYVVAPPSTGYTVVQGKSVPVITLDQRDILLETCRSFNEVVEAPVVKMHSRTETKQYGLSPFEDYNKRGDVVGLLEKHGWKVVKDAGDKIVFKRPGTTDSKSSGDFNRRLNWFSVFTTNSIFEPNKAYLPYAVFAILECEGDFKKASARLLEQGYGEKRQNYGDKTEKEIFKRKQDGATKDELVKYLVSTDKTTEEATEIIDSLEAQWGEKICTFWDIDKNGKIAINRYKLEKFLSSTGGFHLYFYDHNSNIYRVVKVKDGFIEEASTEQIKKFIKEYVNSLPDTFDGGVTPEDLLEVIYKGADSYFTKSFFEFLDHIELNFLKDEQKVAYFPFRNGVVVINKDGVELKSYGDLGRVIWKSEVIDFNITIDQEFEPELCEFYRFIEKISGDDEDRILFCMTTIGYLLHKYKDPAKPYSIILAEETEKETEGGGTGKGIFVKAIGHLLNTERVDGKNFKLDKNFAFQRVGLDTKLVAIEDVRRNVDFEGFYSIITEGITVEKKNKDELFIPYKDSPKIIFTTNYTIPSVGNHAKRRQRVFEFSNHFSSTYTPIDLFGHKLFDDWDNDEWNRFYNFMFFCIQSYLRLGLKDVVNTEKIKRKHIRLNYSEEFLDFWDDIMSNGHAGWHYFTQEYKAFLAQNDIERKDFSVKRFKKALTDSCEIFGYEYKARRNKQNANQTEFKIVYQNANRVPENDFETV